MDIISTIIKGLKNEKEIHNTVNAKDKEGATLLMQAASRGQLEVVQCLVKVKEVDIMSEDVKGFTVLHCACASKENTIEMVKTILESMEVGESEKEYFVNLKDKDGRNAKEVAEENNKMDLVSYLSKWDA